MMSKKFPYKIIDLTHTLDEKSPSWNGGCGFKKEVKLDYPDGKGRVKFRVQQIKMHAGIATHIDAPAHCIPNGLTAESLDLNKLIAPAYCIDISSQSHAEYQLSVEDVLTFEHQYGLIESGSLVIVYTGWSKHWNTPEKYHNHHQFPSISGKAAELLLKRGIVGIGIDTLSPDVPSSGFPTHELVLGSGGYIIENVANADQLPPINSIVFALPIKAAGLTEAPARLIALIPKD